jgi:hypothetical protein
LGYFGFLFFCFNVDCYWFVLVMLLRGLAMALAPVLPNVIWQVLLLQIAVLFALTCTDRAMPWRVRLASRADVATNGTMCLVISLVAVFVDSNDAPTSLLLTIFTVAVFALTAAMLLFSVYSDRVKRDAKAYKYFICHHKMATGAMARLLKMCLLDKIGNDKFTTTASSKVFLDSDNLQNLDILFDTVGTNVECLVVLASREILTRPWCVGEITVSKEANTCTIIVECADYEKPTTDFIENFYKYIQDCFLLLENNIQNSQVKSALQWFGELESVIRIPSMLSEQVMTVLVQNIKDQRFGDVKAVEDNKRTSNVKSSPSIVLAADDENSEALASVRILSQILVQHGSQLIINDASLKPATTTLLLLN